MKSRRGLAALRLGVAVCAALLASSVLAHAQPVIQVLHAFDPMTEGRIPQAAVIQAIDGNFYGTTTTGGTYDKGTVFKMTPDGVITVLYAFGTTSTDGFFPMAALVEASDGNFYGTTVGGGTFGYGTVFKITPAGTLTTLHSFMSGAGDGGGPSSALIQAVDGNFYGTTQTGGPANVGTAFRITPTGTFTLLHAFGGAADGGFPSKALTQTADGGFLGTTWNGGSSGAGTLFRMTPAGVVTVVHTFVGAPSDGSVPDSPLIAASDGNFYGTTRGGGTYNGGTIFRMSPDGTVVVLHPFDNSPPNAGTAPVGNIVQAMDGAIYGATVAGGPDSVGTVFRMTLAGDFTSLASFRTTAAPDTGREPLGGLIQASDGSFYGTAVHAGSLGGGTVFRVSSSARAVIVSPRPGSALTSSTVTFSWSAAPGASEYWLEMGTAVGQHDLFGQSVGVATSTAVSGVPLLNRTLYVKLWTRLAGGWQFSDYTYIGDGAAAMTTPAPGSVLNGASATFNWSTGTGAAQYWLEVGTSAGQGNLFEQSAGLATSQTVNGLPPLGTVFVRLWTQLANGSWHFKDYSYTANAKAVMTSPVPGSQFTGASVTFNWTAISGASQYWIEVGTAAGKSNLFGQGVGLATSQMVSGLPIVGTTIYVRLWTQVNGSWLFNDYIYTAFNAKAWMTSPTIGSTLTGSSVTFNWTAGTGATQYWLEIGTAPGQNNLFGQGVGLATSQMITGLPENGSTISVRLWTQLSVGWVYYDYFYITFNRKAVMTSPAPGSRFSGSSVTFSWSAGSGASAYWLEVKTFGLAPRTLFSQGTALATSQTVNGLPVRGESLLVVLWTQFDGRWESSSYTYSAADTSAAITSPVLGSTLNGTSVTFTWRPDPAATAYWLDVGTDTFFRDMLFSQGAGLSTSLTVSGIPVNGKPIYVKLWTQVDGAWLSKQYGYTAFNAKAVLTAPTPGPALTQSSVQFAWNVVTGASEYWLEVGTTLGSGDIFSRSTGTSTTQTVTGIPTGADAVHVRLWTLFSGVWQYTDSMYGGHLITFGGVGSNGSPLTTYSESTFSVNATSGPWVVGTTYGSPAPFIWFQSPAATTTIAELTIVPSAGPFHFNSIDLYSSTTIIPYEITGTGPSGTVFTFTGTVPNTFGGFARVMNPYSASLVDQLTIKLTNPAAACCSNPVGVDNINLSR